MPGVIILAPNLWLRVRSGELFWATSLAHPLGTGHTEVGQRVREEAETLTRRGGDAGAGWREEWAWGPPPCSAFAGEHFPATGAEERTPGDITGALIIIFIILPSF